MILSVVDDVILFANYYGSIWKKPVSDQVTFVEHISAEVNKCNKHCLMN